MFPRDSSPDPVPPSETSPPARPPKLLDRLREALRGRIRDAARFAFYPSLRRAAPGPPAPPGGPTPAAPAVVPSHGTAQAPGPAPLPLLRPRQSPAPPSIQKGSFKTPGIACVVCAGERCEPEVGVNEADGPLCRVSSFPREQPLQQHSLFSQQGAMLFQQQRVLALQVLQGGNHLTVLLQEAQFIGLQLSACQSASGRVMRVAGLASVPAAAARS